MGSANLTTQVNPQPQATTIDVMLSYGSKKIASTNRQIFLAAISAGVYIALAFVFYITVTTGDNNSSWGITRLIGGMAFSMGLILIVVGGGELFTSSTLLVANRLDNSSSTWSTLRCWGTIYLGNMLGATFCAALVYLAGMHQLDHGQWGENLIHIALHKLHHSPVQAVALGTLCNMLVCLGIWMTFATKDLLTKALLLILPVAMFVSSGFEHSIANLFLLPAAWLVKTLSAAELSQINPAVLNDITISHIVIANLLPVTLGNIIGGGILVGGFHWLTYKKTIINASSKDRTMNHIPTALQPLGQLCQPVELTLTEQTSIAEASQKIRQSNFHCCLVVDTDNRPHGVVHQADLLGAWLSEPEQTKLIAIKELVKPVMFSIEIEESLESLLKKLSKAMQKDTPVSDTGILTNYSETLKPAYARFKSAPEMIPVTQDGKLVGSISCDLLLDEYIFRSAGE